MADVSEVELVEKESQGNQTETTAPTKFATEPTGNLKVTLPEPKKGLKMSLKMSLKKSTKKTDLNSNPHDAGKDDKLPSKKCLESDTKEEKSDEAAAKVTGEVEDQVKSKEKVKDQVQSLEDTKNVKKVEGKSESRSTFAGAFGGLFGKKVAAAADGAVCDVDQAIATTGENLPGIGEMRKDPTNVESCVDGLAGVAGGHQTEPKSEKEPNVTLPLPKKSRKMSLKRSKKKPNLDSNPQDALATVTKVVGTDDEMPKQCLEDGSNTVQQPEEVSDVDPDVVNDAVQNKVKVDKNVIGDEDEDDSDENKVQSQVNRQSKGKVGRKRQSRKVRSAVVSVSKAVGGIIGGQIGSAAVGAIVGVVYDVGTAIATRGDEMNGICGIIKDPTNTDSWVKAAQGELESEPSTDSQDEKQQPKEGTPKRKKSLKSSKSMQKSMEVEADPADQDLVRIYDITSQTMRQILKEAGIALPDYQGGRSVSALVKQLQRLTEMAKNESFTLHSYFKLYDSLHELVTVHKAEFQMTSTSSITLTVASESVVFDENLKRFIAKLLLPVHTAHKVPLKDVTNDKKFHCIYRFRCIICARHGNEFVYVGQSKNFKPRFESHTGQMLRDWIDREERSTLQIGNPLAKFTSRKSSSAVFDHPAQCHPDVVVKFSEILEVDIVHRFIEINKDKTIRKNWETFSQWLFKSIEYDDDDDDDDDYEDDDPEC